MKKSRFLGALLLLALHAVGNQAQAQCGVTMSCGGGNDPAPGTCQVSVCFKDSEAKRQYEKENNCKFPSDAVCNGKKIDEETQCCGKNAKTGKDEIQDKQIRSLNKNFDWDIYQKQCPNMRQSEGNADALWAQCVVGQRHSADDDWPVREVLSNPNNPKARTYCIDGCSTPPGTVKSLYRAGTFIYEDKDNPTGAGGGFGQGASFYGACRQHDICYQTCTSTDRAACDDQMLRDMLAVCARIPENHTTTFTGNFGLTVTVNTKEKCEDAANTMHTGLDWFGGKAFKNRKQQYCQCC